MQAHTWSMLGRALGAPPRPAAWRPSAAAPLCRRQHPPAAPRRSVRPAAALPAQHPPADSELARLAEEAGGRLTKTAMGRLGVAQLREECTRLAIPSDGLKAELVERLMGWWQQAQQAPQQQADAGEQQVPEQRAQQEQPAAAHAAAAASSAAAEQAPAPAAAPAVAAQDPAPDQTTGSRSASPAPQQQPQHAEQQQQRSGSAPGGYVSVTWLGTSSGNPTPRRNVSSIAVHFDEDLYLVDTGEGTHQQMRRADIDPATLRAMFVTHMHGDHCFGAGGVIGAVMEARRGTPQQHEPLLVYGPPELQSLVLAAIRTGNVTLTTPLVVTGLVLDPARARPPSKVDEAGMLQMALQAPDQADRLPAVLAQGWQAAYDQGSEDVVQPGLTWSLRTPGGVRVSAAQLQHRVPCWGYVFQEPPSAAAPPAGAGAGATGAASQRQQQELEREEDQWVRRGRKLVILGDTCDSTAMIPLAMGCDLLSHEATFCSGMEEKANIAQHSTTLQAGAFAAAVEARRLVLTHFSARYETGSRVPLKGKPGGGGAHGVHSNGGQPQDLKHGEMQRLRDETRTTYGRDSIYLASDFFNVEVPPSAPMPASKVQRVQAAQQAAAAAALAAAQQDGGWQARRQQQQGGQRRQYGQQGGGRWQGGEGGDRQRRPGGRQQYGQRERYGQQQERQQYGQRRPAGAGYQGQQ